MPHFISIPAKWYADPEKTQEVTSCAAGQTIYSSYYGQDQEKLTAVQLPDPSLKPDNGLLPDGEEPPKEEILPGDGTAELASPSMHAQRERRKTEHPKKPGESRNNQYRRKVCWKKQMNKK